VSFLSVFIVVLNFEFCLCLVRPRQSGSLAVAKAGPMDGRQVASTMEDSPTRCTEVLSALFTDGARCIATFKDN
jgi:hypothetical protein